MITWSLYQSLDFMKDSLSLWKIFKAFSDASRLFNAISNEFVKSWEDVSTLIRRFRRRQTSSSLFLKCFHSGHPRHEKKGFFFYVQLTYRTSSFRWVISVFKRKISSCADRSFPLHSPEQCRCRSRGGVTGCWSLRRVWICKNRHLYQYDFWLGIRAI